MKKFTTALLFASLALVHLSLRAQLSGIYSVPASYTSIAAAVNALNTQGVNGAVTINIPAGYTETAPVWGYSLNTISGASAVNQVTFRKNGTGVNPIVYAYTGGTATPGSNQQDGVWSFLGTDYVTIDGIDITDLNSSNPATMEFGYAFYRVSGGGNGCQFNTIKNCTITLNRINSGSGSVYSQTGSRGIDMLNCTMQTHSAAVTPTSAGGSNSNNKFYSNLIQNCNHGMVLWGYYNSSGPSPFEDLGNDVGGLTAATGNTIVNYGGGGSTASYGIWTAYQYSTNASNNLFNNNNGGGINHPGDLYGLRAFCTSSSVATFNNNTITLNGGGTTNPMYVMDIQAAIGGGTITVNGNLAKNCTYTTSTSGIFLGIRSSGSPDVLSISSNTFSNISTSQGSNLMSCIHNFGTVVSSFKMNNNVLSGITLTGSSYAEFRGISNIAHSAGLAVEISGNSIQSFSAPGNYSGTFSFIYCFGNTASYSITNNAAINLSVPTNDILYMINNNNWASNNFISGNSIVGTLSKTSQGYRAYGYMSSFSNLTGTTTISNNNFSNIAVTGTTDVYGIYAITSASHVIIVSSNTVSNLSAGSGSLHAINGGYAKSYHIASNYVSSLSGSGEIIGINSEVQAIDSISVVGNTITGLSASGSSTVTGYNLDQSPYLLKLSKNHISNLSAGGPGGMVRGIYTASGFTTMVSNNMVGDLRAPAATHTNAVTGIHLRSASYLFFYHNTVFLNAASSGSAFGSTAFYPDGATYIDMRNNILVNKSAPVSPGVTTVLRTSYNIVSSGTYSASSNNNVLYAGTPASDRLIYAQGAVSYSTVPLFRAFVSPRDNNSKTEDVPFTSTVGTNPAFLHINTGVPTLCESGGSVTPGYNTDYDNDIRYGYAGYSGTGTYPDAGADEFNGIPASCNNVVSGTASIASATVCEGQTIALGATGQSASGAGVTYQWKVGNSASGPFTNVSGGSDAAASSYTSGAVPQGTLYYVMVTTCSASATSATTAPVSLTVIPSPTVTVSSGTLCTGGSYTISPSGGSSYVYSSGSAVVSPTLTTSYTVTGTNSVGCSNTAVVTVTVGPTITISVNSGSVCSGNSFTISPSGAATYSYLNGGPVVSPAGNTTYSITGVSAQGCISSNTAVSSVSVNASPTVGVNSGSICSGNPFVMMPSGAPIVYFSSGSATVSPPTSTNYTVTGVSAQGCSNTAISAVFVSPSPTIAVNSGSMCTGQLFTITPSGVGSYNISGGFSIVSPTTNTNYTVTAVSAQGCPSSNTVVSSVFVAITPTVSVNSGSVCSGNPFTMSPSGANSYAFSSGSSVVSPTVTTSYTVTGTSAQGCSNTAVSAVNVFASPTVAVNSGSICTGSLFTITPSGAASYAISGGTTVVSPAGNAAYSVTGTSTAGCISVNTAVSTVLVYTVPVVSVNSGSICTGSSFVIVPTGAASFVISGGTATVSPTGNTSYSVTGTSSAGCISSNTAVSTVSVYARPLVSVNSGSICSGNSFVIVPTGAASFVITGGSATVSPSGNTSYSITGTSTAGCASSNTAIASVSVYATPVVAVNSGSICSGSSFVIVPTGASAYVIQGGTATVSPGNNASYSVTGTSTAGCISSNTAIAGVSVYITPTVSVNSGSTCSGNSFVIVPTGASSFAISGGNATVSPSGTTSYSVTGTSTAGCMSAMVINTVVVNPTPTVSATGATICSNQSLSLSASGTAISYQWTGPNGFFSSLQNPTIANPAASYSGIYSVTVVSAFGCTNVAGASVSVTALPAVSISNNSPLCEGKTLSLNGSATAGSYAWSGPGGFTSSSANPSITNVSLPASGVYMLVVTQGPCIVSNTVVVSVLNVPVITVNNGSICAGNAFTLSPSGASGYVYVPAGPVVSPAATGTYVITGTAANGCTSTAMATVNVLPLPQMSVASTASMLCVDEIAVLSASGAASYTWSTGANSASIIINPTVTTNYTLTGMSANGCVSSFVATQFVSNCTGIEERGESVVYAVYPNPNNGQFVIEAGSAAHLKVLNALGQLVMEMPLGAGRNPIDLGEHGKGLYVLRVEQGGLIKTSRIIKQ